MTYNILSRYYAKDFCHLRDLFALDTRTLMFIPMYWNKFLQICSFVLNKFAHLNLNFDLFPFLYHLKKKKSRVGFSWLCVCLMLCSTKNMLNSLRHDLCRTNMVLNNWLIPLLFLIYVGLNVEVDRILEIACVVTDGKLTKSVEVRSNFILFNLQLPFSSFVVWLPEQCFSVIDISHLVMWPLFHSPA